MRVIYSAGLALILKEEFTACNKSKVKVGDIENIIRDKFNMAVEDVNITEIKTFLQELNISIID